MQRASRSSTCHAVAGCLLAALAALAGAARGQNDPQRLPPPAVPVDPVPLPAQPAAQPPSLQLGPPAGIDGPQPFFEANPPLSTIETLTPADIPGLGPLGEQPLPGSPLDGLLTDEELYYLPPQKLTSHKSGFFQLFSLSAAWFGNANDPDDLGGTEIEAFLTVALPAPIVEWPLLITPGMNTTFIDGPTVTDLPTRLYFTYVDFTWVPVIINRWKGLLAVAPSVYGDFDTGEFRLTGKALAIYDWIPGRLQLIGGILYLNRDNVRLLPAGGLIWTPADWTRFELLFPKPKLAVRIGAMPGVEDWIFTTAEFGGNTWPIVRDSGLEDSVTYLDYRLIVGFERKLNGGAGYRLEGGYVFGRNITFGSGLGDFDPQNTILIRGVITF